MSPSSSLDRVLKLSERVVRTEQGVKLYNKPIGTPILAETPTVKPVQKSKPMDDKDTPVKTDDKESRPVTLERVLSLQAQAKAALRTGDKSQIRQLKQEFDEALAKYSEDKPAAQVISELKAGIKKK